MTDLNKTVQAQIYSKAFETNRIDYDDFLLPPNDYVREKYYALLNPKKGQKVLEIGIGLNSFLCRAEREGLCRKSS